MKKLILLFAILAQTAWGQVISKTSSSVTVDGTVYSTVDDIARVLPDQRGQGAIRYTNLSNGLYSLQSVADEDWIEYGHEVDSRFVRSGTASFTVHESQFNSLEFVFSRELSEEYNGRISWRVYNFRNQMVETYTQLTSRYWRFSDGETRYVTQSGLWSGQGNRPNERAMYAILYTTNHQIGDTFHYDEVTPTVYGYSGSNISSNNLLVLENRFYNDTEVPIGEHNFVSFWNAVSGPVSYRYHIGGISKGTLVATENHVILTFTEGGPHTSVSNRFYVY